VLVEKESEEVLEPTWEESRNDAWAMCFCTKKQMKQTHSGPPQDWSIVDQRYRLHHNPQLPRIPRLGLSKTKADVRKVVTPS
jgi:hypothetical protein